MPQARDRLLMQPLIRCDSGADGIVRMKETESCSICFLRPVVSIACNRAFLFAIISLPKLLLAFQIILFGAAPPREVFFMKTKFNTRVLTGTAMLAAVATVLMYMEFPIPIMPAFIKLDVSELPALIASFAYGPVAGIVVCLIKNLIKLPSTSTAAVGELFNFVMGALFVGVAGMVYRFKKTRSGAILGAVLGALVMAIVSVPYNYFIVYPAYVVMYHLPLDAIIGMYQAINPNVNGLLNCLLVFNLPFTFFKGMLDAVICFAIYKPLSPILHGRNSDGKSVTA